MNKENEQPNLGCSFLYIYALLIFRVNKYIVPNCFWEYDSKKYHLEFSKIVGSINTTPSMLVFIAFIAIYFLYYDFNSIKINVNFLV